MRQRLTKAGHREGRAGDTGLTEALHAGALHPEVRNEVRQSQPKKLNSGADRPMSGTSHQSGNFVPAAAVRPPQDTDLEEAERLRREQLRLLRANVPFALAAKLVAAAILCLVLWKDAGHEMLGLWFLLHFATVLLRYRHLITFQRAYQFPRLADRWGREFLWWTGLNGLVWGGSAFLFYPTVSLQNQMFMTFLLAGMSAGGLATYSAMFSAVLVFITPATVPVIVQMFRQGGELYLQMGWLSVLFFLVVIVVAWRMNEMTVRALKFGLDNTKLINHLQTVREEEKARIAREIHDELGSTLTKLKMDVSWLSKRLDGGAEALRQTAATMLDLVDGAIGTTRRIATDLRPPILDDLGLCATIKWQADEFQKRLGIRCHLALGENLEDLSNEHAIVLFRVFQESLTNITRHARATDVWVTLNSEDGCVVFTVEDNGIGIGTNARGRPGSYGIQGMHERAKSLGGNMTLKGRDEGGTSLAVTLPLSVL